MGLSMGTAGMPFVLAERAASKGPRSTRAEKGIPDNPLRFGRVGERQR